MNKAQLTIEGNKLIVEKEFDAAVDAVWDAFVTPEVLRQWFTGPDAAPMQFCEVDLRVGGRFRYEWKLKDGSILGMSGKFLEIIPHQKIVNTEAFDVDMGAGETINTSLFEELDGRTRYKLIGEFESAEALAELNTTDMEAAMNGCYDRLEVCARAR